MNHPNPAQQKRSAIIRAVAEQQDDITSLKQANANLVRLTRQQDAQIGHLTRAVASIAVSAGVGSHPHFAGLVRQAGLKIAETDTNNNPSGAPSTSTGDAKKPDATDSVENVGAAPGEVNKGVTPEGVTDVNNSDVVANPPMLDHLQDATAPVSGTDAPTPAAGDAAGTSTVTVGTPSNESFDKPGDSGWSTASRERFVASQRLARLQIRAGIQSGDDLVLAESIDKSAASLDVINAQIETLASLPSREASAPSADQRRRLVPQARQAGIVPARQQPSLQSTAAGVPEDRADEDQWLVGNID